MVTLIAAVARNRVIGNGNAIPWHLPEDFKHFSTTTKGHAVIMGSSTWDSLPEKFRPLPGRLNIVVSRKRTTPPTAKWAGSVEHAIAIAKTAWRHAEGERAWIDPVNRASVILPASEEIFIIGGASIYEQAMAFADRLIISEVDMEPEGDTLFPVIGPEWIVSSRDERNAFTILDYKKSLTTS